MPACPEPPPPDPDEEAWRLEVGRFRASLTTRTFPMRVCVGVPGGERVAVEVPWPVPPEYDEGQRFDLLVALLERWSATADDDGCAWLSRVGAPEPHDQDHLWHATALRAFAAHERPLRSFRVLTRAGWLELPSGRRRTWVRLRL